MFCSHCGAKAANSFCSSCGQPLERTFRLDMPHDPAGWHNELRYEVLLHFPEVRNRISEAAKQAKSGLTGEEWLELIDKAYVPLVGVSLSKVSSIVVPIYSKLGVQVKKQQQTALAQPIGQVIVGAICSLARHGRTLKEVHPASDGCVIEAIIPSDIWSFAGELCITIHRQAELTEVTAATKIPGQYYDWGKSKQCLRQLFDDLQIVTASVAE